MLPFRAMFSTPEERLIRLIRHAHAGYALARRDSAASERARAWLLAHPSALPEADALWLSCLDGRGPLAAWLDTDAGPEQWPHHLALHSVLACHPFPDLPQWVEVRERATGSPGSQPA